MYTRNILMTDKYRTEFIDQEDHLAEFGQVLAQSKWIAIDTEFMRDRTYFPVFCLLQVAISDRVACIDLLALPALDLIKPALLNAQIPKIIHSGRQDLELFYQLWQMLPSNVIDTQIASALLGGHEQVGYARMVEDLFKVKLAKEHTRTDWSQRPLSSEQLRYASDDVAYLWPAYEALHGQLTELGRLTWLIEDSSELLVPDLYQTFPEHAWQRINGAGKLAPEQRHRLQLLAAWREDKAQQLNIPRNWVCRDDLLCQWASTAAPLLELPRSRGVSKQEQRRCNQEIRALLDDPRLRLVTDHGLTLSSKAMDAEAKALLNKLRALVLSKARELDISPTLLATRRDLECLLEAPNSCKALRGWRRAIIGESLLACLPTHLRPADPDVQ